jgi:hypothetical protein
MLEAGDAHKVDFPPKSSPHDANSSQQTSSAERKKERSSYFQTIKQLTYKDGPLVERCIFMQLWHACPA